MHRIRTQGSTRRRMEGADKSTELPIPAPHLGIDVLVIFVMTIKKIFIQFVNIPIV